MSDDVDAVNHREPDSCAVREAKSTTKDLLGESLRCKGAPCDDYADVLDIPPLLQHIDGNNGSHWRVRFLNASEGFKRVVLAAGGDLQHRAWFIDESWAGQNAGGVSSFLNALADHKKKYGVDHGKPVPLSPLPSGLLLYLPEVACIRQLGADIRMSIFAVNDYGNFDEFVRNRFGQGVIEDDPAGCPTVTLVRSGREAYKRTC